MATRCVRSTPSPSSISREKRRFSSVLADRSSSCSRASSTPRLTSARRIHSASVMASPGPCPPERITGTSGCLARYAAAASMRVRSESEGVSPFTPAPSTMTALTGASVFSASEPRMTIVSNAAKRTKPAASSASRTRLPHTAARLPRRAAHSSTKSTNSTAAAHRQRRAEKRSPGTKRSSTASARKTSAAANSNRSRFVNAFHFSLMS